MRLPVFVAAWQIECCWEPPSVGDVIGWHLAFVETPDAEDLVERGWMRLLEVSGQSFGDHTEPFEGRYALQLDAPGVSLYWMAPRRALGPLQLSGYIHEDHHAEVPSALPTTYGLIHSIKIEERVLSLTTPESRTWEPNADTPTYTNVATSPKWFVHQMNQQGDTRKTQSGILVEIEIITRPLP